ncbi:MAG: hypothetical protein BWY65_01249 [Firmicutes bacterium ADurb.Bin373]|nr:MAG: hypothetical protein BWY65_01249 [Firmicutes bacterium ADurb.Bin373]
MEELTEALQVTFSSNMGKIMIKMQLEDLL